MTEALAIYVSVSLIVVLVGAVFIPRFGHKKLQSGEGGSTIGGGGVVDRIASLIVLTLGRVTFSALHLFEKLGVDMAREDEIIASWTSWSENIKRDLADALADAQNLRDTDAAEDAAQANALSEALADKLQSAFDAVTAGPAEETPDVPGPPNTPPSTDAPVTDVPDVDPEPVDPGVDIDVADQTDR